MQNICVFLFGVWVQREVSLDFSIFSSGGHVVQQSGIICTILI